MMGLPAEGLIINLGELYRNIYLEGMGGEREISWVAISFFVYRRGGAWILWVGVSFYVLCRGEYHANSSIFYFVEQHR